jgi:hypothetical protein
VGETIALADIQIPREIQPQYIVTDALWSKKTLNSQEQITAINTMIKSLPVPKEVLPSVTETISSKPIQRKEQPVQIKRPTKTIDLAKIVNTIKEKITPKRNLAEEKNKIIQKKKHAEYSPLGIILMVCLWLGLLPFITIAISSLSLIGAGSAAKKADVSHARTFIRISNGVNALTSPLLQVITEIPGIGKLYQPVEELSLTLTSVGQLAENSITTAIDLQTIAKNALENESYNLPRLAQSVSLHSSEMYADANFLINKTKSFTILPKSITNLVTEATNQLPVISASSQIATQLEDLLGWNSPKTYLVVFQNNMELRPTGGFIGSFGIIRMEKGKLIDFSISDIYQADGQLKGYVAPPDPLKKYLDVSQWYMRDANWDPDFTITAKRAEWFLEKTMDVKVDGVVGTDLEVVKALLRAVGPIKIEGVDDEITEKNMYGKIQYEVEKDFFPGSYKKTNILSELAKKVTEKAKTSSSETQAVIAKNLLALVSQRHIQVYVHNEKVQSAIANMGWDASLWINRCGDNCEEIPFGIVDANLGVNKVNYFVKRKMHTDIAVSKNQTQISVTVQYENTAPKAIAEAGLYKNYVRIATDKAAQFQLVSVIQNNQKSNKVPDIVTDEQKATGGVYIEVPAGQKASVTFTIIQPLSNIQNWALPRKIVWRKQAGTLDDEVSARIRPQDGLSLTPGTKDSYNTSLIEDLILEARIKQ